MVDSPRDIAASWLKQYAEYLASADVPGAVSTFLPDGWLRDVLIFTWNNRSLAGHTNISAYLTATLRPAQISNIKLDERPGLGPVYGQITPIQCGVSASFTFTSTVANGQGYFRLLRNKVSGEWKALTVFMAAQDLKGHEEVHHEEGMHGNHTLSWEEVSRERRAQVEGNPHVLIVGAGQTGLNIAARFKQMKIPTLVIEANPRVGDNWRKRYPTMTLHTPRAQHNMLYQPYPQNWPMFTPRDKLANWLEQYVESQDLIVWTGSRLLPGPKYDFSTKTWSVIVDRHGAKIELRPAHIVMATGTLSAPRVPSVRDPDDFQGTILHTSQYQGGHLFAGKCAVVVGAGNTSADICQDLSFRGAKSITMVQRSSTCVISLDTTVTNLGHVWREGVPIDICDFQFAAMPFGLLRKILSSQEEESWAKEREMHDGLRKAGLKLTMGTDGSGLLPLVYERHGGYWVDVGCAQLIASGRVKVKQGVEVDRLTKDSVVFTDGSTLEADVVVFATGYHNIRELSMEIFGPEVVDRVGEVWGLDAEGELKGCYRPSGHPGLWYGAGDFYHSRFMSKQLAIQIKGIELGLMSI